MKKIVSGIVIGTILAGTTVAGAASEQITAYNSPQVKFTFNGVQKNVPEGYSTIIYNDRTYVPARFVTENLGATVNWDGNTQTVEIVGNTSNNRNDVTALKLYSRIAEHYRQLMVLHDLISGLSQGVNLAYDDIEINNSLITAQNVDNTYNQIVQKYDEMILLSESLINEANANGLNIYDTREILSKYQVALNYYSSAIDNIYAYYSSRSYEDGSKYLDNSGKGFDTSLGGSAIANTRYNEFYSMIQSY